MMLLLLKSLILGIVEGLTEFLPISSTGHLILVNQWVHFSEPFTKMFDIVIQFGAILAVVVVFFSKLWPFTPDAAHNRATWSLWFKTIVAVVPALVFGALLGDFIEEKLFSPWVVAIALMVGGVALVALDRRHSDARMSTLAELSYGTAFTIGLIQCLAMIPGTSRSAATIIGALLLGTSHMVAVEFSFFLAIPTMVAATAYSLLKHGSSVSSSEAAALAVGFVVAFLTAFFVIRFFLAYVQRHSFSVFGWYRVVLGVLVVIYFAFVPATASAHLDAGEDVVVGKYLVDFGYTPEEPRAGEPIDMALNLVDNASQKMITPSSVWVRISRGEQVVSTATYAPVGGNVTWQQVLPAAGRYDVEIRFSDAQGVVATSTMHMVVKDAGDMNAKIEDGLTPGFGRREFNTNSWAFRGLILAGIFSFAVWIIVRFIKN